MRSANTADYAALVRSLVNVTSVMLVQLPGTLYLPALSSLLTTIDSKNFLKLTCFTQHSDICQRPWTICKPRSTNPHLYLYHPRDSKYIQHCSLLQLAASVNMCMTLVFYKILNDSKVHADCKGFVTKFTAEQLQTKGNIQICESIHQHRLGIIY